MTGLDKIIDQIKAESDKAVTVKISEANQRAEAIIQEAKAQINEECADIESLGRQKAEDTLSRATSAAALYKKKTLLAEKQRIISETFDKAEERLNNLGDAEYFEFVKKIAVKNALPKDGILLLSAKDMQRLPAGFEAALNSMLNGGSLKVSTQPADIGYGFVLSYGGIEENCTFRALIDSERETLADKVQELLF